MAFSFLNLPLLFLLILFLSAFSTVSTTDPTYFCGNLNFSYPFSFYNSEATSRCGYPDLTVICKNGSPFLPLESGNFTIVNIDLDRNIIHLADPDVADLSNFGPCLIIHQDSSLPSGSPLNRTTNDIDLTFLYGCEHLPPSFDPITCLKNEFNNRSSYVFVESDVPTGYNYLDLCNKTVQTTVLQSTYSNLELNATFGLLLIGGFDLSWKWNSAECTECERSGGWCSYKQPDNYFFTCFSSKECGDNSLQAAEAGGKKKPNHTRKIIIGTSLGAGSLLLCCIIFLCYKHSKRNEWSKKPKNYHEMELMNNSTLPLVPQLYTFTDIRRMTKSFVEKLGQGGYGSVYKGTLPGGSRIAVKVFKDYKGDGEDFITEVNAIARTAHVNIVRLFGFAIKGSQRALVYEFMPNGSLDKYLGQRQYKKFTDFGYQKLLKIAVGIAQGLEYLHRGCNTRIIHLDIKPHNILLDRDFQPKISDFGLAKFCRPNESSILMSNMRGTIGYIAPEVFSREYGEVSTKSDVYSYGMLLIEMSGRRESGKETRESSSSAYFPNWVYECIEEKKISATYGVSNTGEEIVMRMMLIGLWCTQVMLDLRPSMGEVLQMLEGRLEDLTVPSKLHIPLRPVPVFTSTTTIS